jgi:nicotinate-nucleotide adenylyltransferase
LNEKTIVLFGGTFNPPHLGHEDIVGSVLTDFLPDFMLIVPSANHPYKTITIDFEHRFKMCELAFEKFGKKVCVSRMQLRNNEGYYYNLVQLFKKEFPKNNFVHVIGEDCAINISKWHRGSDLVKEEKFLVFERKSEGEVPWYKKDGNQFLELQGNHFTSSSSIREDSKNLKMVSEPVKRYILTNNLYP